MEWNFFAKATRGVDGRILRAFAASEQVEKPPLVIDWDRVARFWVADVDGASRKK
jgi:hypothetical protein